MRKNQPLLSFSAVVFAALFVVANAAKGVDLTAAEAARVGQKIWQNECAGTVEGLVSWNEGEAFPSLGIGHFIWYPEGKTGPFEESFPKLVVFLEKRGVRVPDWLKGAAPWSTAGAMKRDGERVAALRALLAKTVGIQTEFLIARLDAALPKMLAETKDDAAVTRNFGRMKSTPSGAFALIDYVNFKGEGVAATERYAGQGWGLLQVLEGMPASGAPVEEFSESAKRVLARRVASAPKERREERWLPGWHARAERYKAGL